MRFNKILRESFGPTGGRTVTKLFFAAFGGKGEEEMIGGHSPRTAGKGLAALCKPALTIFFPVLQQPYDRGPIYRPLQSVAG